MQQGLVLRLLSANLATTFANSTSTVDIPNSSVENQEQNVFILFQLNQRSLSMKSYSLAMEKISGFVKQWGPKEIDFEVGSGPQNSTAGGVFQVRLSRNPLPGDTGNTTTGSNFPAFFGMVIPLPKSSVATSANQTSAAFNVLGVSTTRNGMLKTRPTAAVLNFTGVSAIRNATFTIQSRAANLNATAASTTRNALLTTQSAATALNTKGLSASRNATLTTQFAASVRNNTGVSATRNATLTTYSVVANLNVAKSSGTKNFTQSTATALIAIGVSTTGTANSTIKSAASGVVVPHRGTLLPQSLIV